MAWVYLLVAGLFEVTWAVALKSSNGFTQPAPSIVAAVGMVLSVVLLGLAIREIPVGNGYAIWTGIGTIGTALVGIWLYGEPITPMRIGAIALILIGVVGLRFAG
jgi:quaternary ammonium compound-resistance protein SugE